ncbi:MAG: outer membrane beta-barrel protein [Dyadobacter sp.]|uniref:outer membrane beta-barrel protein n=1 Tax=Dyadobacter sp. TaxID=1914288 RepID=UPI001B16C9D8|nr:outer membrane beta-barrel protein [Dyadobacter sp.]MBO9611350.1 outer membrane beta-barrel protein [Dyadobacter sp.]
MKCISLCTLIVTFFLLCPCGYAQTKLSVGVRFLPSSTMFRYDTGVPIADFLKIAPHYSRIRTAQGVGVNYNPARKLHVGADLLYAFQGGGFEQRRADLAYIHVPLWIGYNTAPEKKLIFTVQSGIQLSYLTHAKLQYENGTSANIAPYLHKMTMGIPFAIGFKFRLTPSYYLSTQLYLSSDLKSLSRTNKEFGVYNYVFPGLRIALDRNI